MDDALRIHNVDNDSEVDEAPERLWESRPVRWSARSGLLLAVGVGGERAVAERLLILGETRAGASRSARDAAEPKVGGRVSTQRASEGISDSPTREDFGQVRALDRLDVGGFVPGQTRQADNRARVAQEIELFTRRRSRL